MKEQHVGATCGFRPRGQTAVRLDYAARLGWKQSEVVNAVLDLHLGDWLKAEVERKKRTLRELLSAPVP